MTRTTAAALAILLTFGAFAPDAAHAQGLVGRARAAAQRAAERVVEGAAGSVAGGPAEAPPTDTGATAAAAYAASAPTGAVIFATTFAGDAPGDFPAGFELGSGTWEVADVRGRRVLRATAFGEIHVELPDDLPEQFTLEFEMAAPMGWSQDVRFEEHPLTYVHLAPDRGGLSGRTNALSQPASNPGGGRFFPVRIVADGESVKVYHSRTLVANVPQAEIGRSNRITFALSASQDNPVLLADVRLTSGSAGTPTQGNPNYPGPTPGTPARGTPAETSGHVDPATAAQAD